MSATSAKRVCAYCNSVNEAAAETCLACGAPLATLPVSNQAPVEALSPPPLKTSPVTVQDLKKAGEGGEQVYNTALRLYGTAWRTLGEAIAIGLSAFLLGLIGSLTGAPLGAILAALAVGVAVGLVTKNYYLTMISAPAGVIVGAALWAFPWALGYGSGGMALSAGLFAVLGALLGARRLVARRDLWDRLRPLLGALGGLLFVLLGSLAGWIIRWLALSLGRWNG